VRWAPLAIVSDSLAVSRPAATGLSPWTGLAVLCLYAAAPAPCCSPTATPEDGNVQASRCV
jgi:hypothetical protein